MTINTTKIDLLKAELRLTNIALAERSGISRQSISTILQRGTCSPINAGKLAAGLGVPVSEIIKKGE
ncbi:MAG: helix-turn-helix transcriptional regulator [Ruminococcaceae bacterium]|nr:helix-turn-helix transcriptional regulator [Oscillospiraceae bacterium]